MWRCPRLCASCLCRLSSAESRNVSLHNRSSASNGCPTSITASVCCVSGIIVVAHSGVCSPHPLSSTTSLLVRPRARVSPVYATSVTSTGFAPTDTPALTSYRRLAPSGVGLLLRDPRPCVIRSRAPGRGARRGRPRRRARRQGRRRVARVARAIPPAPVCSCRRPVLCCVQETQCIVTPVVTVALVRSR